MLDLAKGLLSPPITIHTTRTPGGPGGTQDIGHTRARTQMCACGCVSVRVCVCARACVCVFCSINEGKGRLKY